MGWLNSRETYGWLAVLLHWITAVAVIGLFAVGLYMVELDYYDPWYRTLPDWHRSIGLLLAALVTVRLVLRLFSTTPEPLPEHDAMERIGASAAHGLLYLLMFGMFVSGYLMSTAEGSGIWVFNWFEVPSLTGPVDGMEDWAGTTHYWMGWGLILLATLHALAALKHHFVDRDRTLLRMLGK